MDPLKKRLIICNFINSDENPIVIPLEGKQGIALYQNEINVDLDALREIIEEDIPDWFPVPSQKTFFAPASLISHIFFV